MLYSLLQRIPSVWIALVVGGLGAWVYLRTVGNNDPVTDAIKDRVSGVVLVYIFFSKFVAGLIFHPSPNLRDDIFSMLGGSGTNGWLVGILAAMLYLLYGLHTARVLGRRAFAVAAEGTMIGSIFFFAYLAVVNINPFRLEFSLRSIGAILLLLWAVRKRAQLVAHPQRLWAAFEALLFVTSVLALRTTVLFVFSPAQWLFIGVIAGSLVIEGIADLKGLPDSPQTHLTEKGQIQHDFNEDQNALNGPNNTVIDHTNEHDAH